MNASRDQSSDPTTAEGYPSNKPELGTSQARLIRRETFLARYPRNFKFGVAGVIGIVGAALWFLVLNPLERHQATRPTTVVQTADFKRDQSRVDLGAKNNDQRLLQGDITAPAINAQDDHSIKMTPAPDPHLTEDTPDGPLPRIGEDGLPPWQAYARSFNTTDRRPRIAIIITGLGLSRDITDAAINRLPANVTLSFDISSSVAGAWCARARQDGHEIILQLPMEPFDYPRSDPGPNTLLTTLPSTENIERLLWGLRRGTGYVGVTTLSGSRFTTETGKLQPILNILKTRGLMFVDARVAPHSAVMDLTHDMKTPAVAVNIRVDQNLSPEAIDAAFEQITQYALHNGRAVGMFPPAPLVLEKLQVWLKQLPDQGIALAPVSAMAM